MSLPKSTGCARLDNELVLDAWDWDWMSEPDIDEAKKRWKVAPSEARAPGLQEPTHISVTTPGGEHVLVRSDSVQAGIDPSNEDPSNEEPSNEDLSNEEASKRGPQQRGGQQRGPQQRARAKAAPDDGQRALLGCVGVG